MKFGKINAALAVGMLAAVALSGCGVKYPEGTQTGASPSGTNVFRILAGSELKDVAAEVQQFASSKGMTVQMDYTGSLDAIDRLSEKHNYDAVWVSHGKYLQIVPAVQAQIKSSEKTMYSRVVLGIKPEKAKELGWNLDKSNDISWKAVIEAVKAKKLKLAMTNPSGSNTGFVTLVGVAAELSGKGDALTEADIPTEQLKDLFAGISLTSGSSGDLMDKFKADPTRADAVINYESAIRLMSNSGTPLLVAYPKEGIITADYPLMLLKSSTNQAFYDQLVAHLRDPVTQQKIAQTTLRTPLTGDDSQQVVNELPFPGSLAVVDALLSGFLNEYSKAASSYFVIDVSGSMSGERLTSAKQAMTSLVTSDGTVSGRFSLFRAREKIRLTPFSGTVQPTKEFMLGRDATANAKVLSSIGAEVAALQASGGTAIYDALLAVYDKAQAELKAGDRSVSIVLLTDGANSAGANLNEFLNHVKAAGAPTVPVYGILYGEANSEDMATLTRSTDGKAFDARKTSLKTVLKAIRNYQ
jgi:Ca-activated chloride channel family protein